MQEYVILVHFPLNLVTFSSFSGRSQMHFLPLPSCFYVSVCFHAHYTAVANQDYQSSQSGYILYNIYAAVSDIPVMLVQYASNYTMSPSKSLLLDTRCLAGLFNAFSVHHSVSLCHWHCSRKPIWMFCEYKSSILCGSLLVCVLCWSASLPPWRFSCNVSC